MTITTNVNPYYDDFDEFKNFHQILFKPGFAVQARELTQIQSILQDQIRKFGNHIFRHGSVVIPGNSTSDLYAQYTKLQTVNPLLASSDIEGKIVVGGTSQLRAYVRKYVPTDGTDPATIYVNYLRGGDYSVFVDNEILTIEGTTNTLSTAITSATGVGSLAFVNSGVFYINGKFVSVSKQTAVISKYSSVPSAHVVLKINESIVTSGDDDTLLDPSQGSYNYSAPGADRYKVELTLASIPYDAEITDDLVELMRYNSGVLEEHIRYPKYNELEKNLARRTYDESGDYVVNGLQTSIREHKKIEMNDGLDANGDLAKFVATISDGKAYIRGFENEKLAPTNLILDKGRTADHIKSKSVSLQPDFGQYLYVTNLTGALPTDVPLKTVNLFNASTGGTQIGTMKVSAIDFHEGDTAGTSTVYRLYFNDLTFSNSTYTTESIGRIEYTISATTYTILVLHKLVVPRTNKDFTTEIVTNSQTTPKKATVYRWVNSTASLYVYKHSSSIDVPVLGNSITGETSGATGGNVEQKVVVTSSQKPAQIFPLPVDSVSKVKNSSNISDITYKVYKPITITTDSSGNGSTSISSGTVNAFEAGNYLFIGPSGVVDISKFAIVGGSTVTATASGVVSGKIYGVVSVNKTLSEKSKTKTTVTETVTLSGGIGTLSNSDIFKVTSIISDGTDVTNLYTIDNGQRDYAYLKGTITLKSGTAPSSVSVTYDYFAHGVGDYFTPDSYSSLGPDYLSMIPTYIAKSDGSTYDLRNCIDFRQREITTGVFDSMDIVQPNNPITTSVQYYVPRIDLVFMSKGGRIGVVTGEPSENPAIGIQPEGTIALSTLYVPAYTKDINDIVVTKEKHKVYTMADIANLESRIYNIEQFTLLTQTENNLINYDVIDAVTGKSRYKSGYLVENFDNPEIISDIYSTEFNATYHNNLLYPKTEKIDVDMTFTAGESSNYQNTGGMLTLPYTTVVMAKQNLSTRVTNVNPFSVFSWVGELTLNPKIDNFVDNEELPEIINVVDVDDTRSVTRNWDDWAPIRAKRVTKPLPTTNLITLTNVYKVGGKTRILKMVWNGTKFESTWTWL